MHLLTAALTATLMGAFFVVPEAEETPKKAVEPNEPALEIVAGGFDATAIAVDDRAVYVAEQGRVFAIAKDGSVSVALGYAMHYALRLAADESGVYWGDAHGYLKRIGDEEPLIRSDGWPSPIVLEDRYIYVAFAKERVQLFRIDKATEEIEVLYDEARDKKVIVQQLVREDGRLWWLEEDVTDDAPTARLYALSGSKAQPIASWKGHLRPAALGVVGDRPFVAKPTGLFGFGRQRCGGLYVERPRPHVATREAKPRGITTTDDAIYWTAGALWKYDLTARRKHRLAGASRRLVGPVVDDTHVYWMHDTVLWRTPR